MPELSKEITYQILQDLAGDNAKLQEITSRMLQQGGGYAHGLVDTVDYRDLDMLKYIIKTMEQRVKVLSGSAY